MTVRFAYEPDISIIYTNTAIITPNCSHHIIFDLNGGLYTGLVQWNTISGTIWVSSASNNIFISVISPIALFYNPL